MRRKSERTATKKTKDSPEKERKVEKVKRTRTKRRKQSSSSENESADEKSSVPEPVPQQKEKDAEPAAVKEDSPEETPDQVWQVKTPTKAGDTGEIQKLKICLTRPPSTPEREKPPKSPRSKRKHSRATSSSDTPSVDGEEKKKGKHKSKRSSRDSKDEQEKNQESQSDEPSKEEESEAKKTTENEVSQSSESKEPDNTPVSTTDDNKADEDVQSSETKITAEKANTESQDKPSADDTVTSSKLVLLEDQHSEVNTSSEKDSISDDKKNDLEQSQSESPVTKIPESDDAEQPVDVPEGTEGKCADNKSSEYQELEAKTEETAVTEKVSDVKVKSKKDIDTGVRTSKESHNTTNNTDVVEKRYNQQDKDRKAFIDSNKDLKEAEEKGFNKLEGSDCIHSTQEEINGPSTPIIINRKRRWGSRPNKVSSQKSITISTEVLKDIIPDVVKPAEFEEVIEEKKHKKIEMNKKIDRPILPKIVIDNTEHIEHLERDEKENIKLREILPLSNRKISIVNDNDNILARPPSPPRHKQSSILYITNLVRPFTLPLLKNLLQRTGKIVENGFWIDRIKSKCFVQYETEDQAVETRHALHGVTWPVSNPKTLQVDFSTREAFDKAKSNEENDTTPVSTIPGTVEDWLREQDMKRERGELEKPWERKTVREWDVGKGEKDKEDKMQRNVKDERLPDKRRHRSVERSPEPARKFKKREEEAPAKLLDDLFRKTKTTPCIYWLPLSAETIAIKEEQRRQHMAEYERRLNEQRRTRDRRH